jgi:translation initiation factor 5B
MKTQNALLVEDEKKRRKEYATILAFDVKSLPEAEAYAKKTGVHIIHAEIIYHLCDKYKEWVTQCQNERKQQLKKDAVFPCVLKPIAFFNKKDPIIMGCDVSEGVLKIDTPICVFKEDKV